MKLVNQFKLMQAAAVLTGALSLMLATPLSAQDYPPQPPSFSPQQLDSIVSRIALYPDPLLAQVFAAASFPDQIPDAARWADQYRNLQGEELANAIAQSNLPFDPAVQSLLPFPTILDTMASDMSWTGALGNAVLADRSAVMDAVQRMRRTAEQYGYLQSNQQVRVVNQGPSVEILPADPSYIYVPYYDPYVVYAPPRPGFFIGGAIGYRFGFGIGAFGGWGWGGGFNWYNHSFLVNHAVWGRDWDNRNVYVHNYGNWDRGEWRNQNYNRTVVNNYNVNRTVNSGRGFYGSENTNRGYQPNGSYNRNGSAQSAQAAPSQAYRPNATYNRGGAAQTYQAPSYQAAPSQAYRPNAAYNRGGAAQTYQAPSYQAAPSRSYQPNAAYNRGGAAQSYQAPSYQAAPSHSYQAPASSPRSEGFYRGGGQQAPARGGEGGGGRRR